jgi:hypothetical protein
MSRFSERIGEVTPRDAIQIGAIDAPLRSALWNAVEVVVFAGLPAAWISDRWQWQLAQNLWIYFYRRPVDEIDPYWPGLKQKIRDWYFAAQWHEVYDFVEFLVQQLQGQTQDRFRAALSEALSREMAGYRFVGDELAPITDEQEISTIERALAVAAPLRGIQAHLNAAIGKLADRQAPDYRNSIKESISAVEALCMIITGDNKATLGQAIKRLRDRGLKFHPALEKAWSSLYGYTSDENGIRHAMLEEPNLTQADAKYFLVSCSAFISYLVQLAGEAGVSIP